MSGPLSELPPAPAQRNPMVAPMPGAAVDAGITDDDLMTDDERAALAPPPGIPEAPHDHDENIAELLAAAPQGATWLNATGQKLLEMVEADLRSRGPWEQRFKRGLEIVGLTDYVWSKGLEPFEGASTAIAPVLALAIVQSQARFMEEIFPAEGPVKTEVMGSETPQKRDAADRVDDHMNYQLTIEDTVYPMESEKLSLYNAIFGSAYRKGYHDYVTDQNVLRFVPATDLILPYAARNLQSSPRITHRFPVTSDEFKDGVAAGAYRDIDLQEAKSEAPDRVEQEKDKVDGVVEDEAQDDISWMFYEMDVRLSIPGFEDRDAHGNPTGIANQYVVTLEKASGDILAIRRNWDVADKLKLRETRYAEYWYLPGLGVYGTGLIHWIGTVAESATDALRALLDSATWANLQGGFKAKDAGAKAGELVMRPGVWVDVDMTADELQNAFHTPPTHEPSPALFQLLGYLGDQAQKFSSTSDLMIGEQDAKGAPVGTTVALIEQGSKVYSGIHKRAHLAAGVEFRMLFKLNAKHIPAEGYPYQVPGNDLQVYQADYNEKLVGVVPVSDPNIYSQTQRIALAQACYQLYKDNPDAFRRTAVLRNLLKAMKHPDIENCLIDDENMPDVDPVTENAAMATGHPAHAIEGQDHDAHLLVHMAFMQHPQFGGLPQAQQVLGPPMMAHIAAHLALKQADIFRKLGVPVPKMNLTAAPGTPLEAGDQQQPQPGGAQPNQIAQAAAAQVQAFMQQSGLTTTPPNQQDAQLGEDLQKAKIFNLISLGAQALAKAGATFQEEAANAGNVVQDMTITPPAPGGAPPAMGTAVAPPPPPGAAPLMRPPGT